VLCYTILTEGENMIERPDWIDPDITVETIRLIVKEADLDWSWTVWMCALDPRLGRTATRTMQAHGGEVYEFLQAHEGHGEVALRATQSNEPWASICVRLVSTAVELWCDEALKSLDA
jgi:hypothetical protein